MLVRKKSEYSTAVYLRLSREDGDKAESDSIHNQRELINSYLKSHCELIRANEYVDDGYSGTSFDRPGFKSLLEDINRGKIDCIIVKDLSRLGRNYIETGKYLERVFPALGIRFISINDNYDSLEDKNDVDQIIIPFKNLINDAYCRDISIKIRSQLDVKRREGKFIGSFASYGYKKDPLDKNHLIVDDFAADIVKSIFSWKLDGYSNGRIADRLNSIGVLTPMEYKRSCGFNFKSGFRLSENPTWSSQMVGRILANEYYIGTTAQGKNQKINYKVKKSIPIEEDKWIRVENTHTAIIPQAVFENVQFIMGMDTRTAPDKEKLDYFSGIVKCADCGQNMIRKSTSKNGKKYYYYHCSSFKNGQNCTAHRISAEKLKSTVLKVIQLQISQFVEADKILQSISEVPKENFKIKRLDDQKEKMIDEINRNTDMKLRLYQDFTVGIVTEAEYKEFKVRFETKIENAKNALIELEKKRGELDLNSVLEQPWIEEFRKFKNIKNLDRKILVSIIEKIIIYAKDRIEVCFKFEDEFNAYLDYAKETRYMEAAENGLR